MSSQFAELMAWALVAILFAVSVPVGVMRVVLWAIEMDQRRKDKRRDSR
jgi:hypothetical protein